MQLPRDAIDAVTHPDPYPFYAELAARPLHRDEGLGLWIAAGAGAVEAVLTSDLCRVRPPAEPVPRALLGSPAAEVFRHLVRMNDGGGHCPWKRAVSAALASIDEPRAAAASRDRARRLLDGIAPEDLPGAIVGFALRLPVEAVGSLLGIPRAELAATALRVADFAGCLAPAASPQAIERGKAAAGALLERMCGLLGTCRKTGGSEESDALLATLAIAAARVGRADPDAIAANAIGFLFQAYEATAALIANTLRALAVLPGVREAVRRDRGLLRDAVQEVLRHDPPVQNTRRFVARSGIVAGREMREGDAILVVLAAAQRDPSANPEPDRFDLQRKGRRLFGFGAGAHACPGEALAATIAEAGVAALLAAGLAVDLEVDSDIGALAGPVAYRPSVNVRMPLLGMREPRP